MTIDLRLDPAEVPLLVDLYELTMAASFFEHAMNETACFSLSVRRLPPMRGYMVAAGLERLMEALEQFTFDAAAIDYLDSLKLFSADFLQFLGRMRFSGEVSALVEGTLFFAEEPVLQVSAPLIEAQLLETLAINQIGMASMIATKAARCYSIAEGRRLVDFGARRAQGADAALIAARSSYLAGFAGSSNVLAGRRFGIPLFGTMAHSYVMAHESERAAFENFARSFPRLSTLLVDTFSTPRGVENAVAVARKLADEGIKLQGVRLDSGDLAALSRQARRILDANGLNDAAIFASGNLDEYAIADLVKAAAPIDAFGVGTAMVTSADAPSLDMTYKLVEYKGVARMKTSEGKISLPGRKQIFRVQDAAGKYAGDLIGLADEGPASIAREFRHPGSDVRQLLTVQFKDGKRTAPRPSLSESREQFVQNLGRLDQRYKAIRKPDTYPVGLSRALKAMQIGEKLRAESRQE